MSTPWDDKKKEQVWAYCSRCQHHQPFVRVEIRHGPHLLLTILTGGLWFISWLATYLGRMLRPWRCEHCGWHKPEFRPGSEGRPVGYPEPPKSERAARSGKSPPLS